MNSFCSPSSSLPFAGLFAAIRIIRRSTREGQCNGLHCSRIYAQSQLSIPLVIGRELHIQGGGVGAGKMDRNGQWRLFFYWSFRVD